VTERKTAATTAKPSRFPFIDMVSV
jgi:hypothetical protein